MQSRISGGSDDDEALLRTAAPMSDLSEDDFAILDELMAAMHRSSLCVGLAAPQLGYSKRLAVATVFDDEGLESFIELINPIVESTSGSKDEKRESCMSIWGFTAPVERRKKLTLKNYDRHGNLEVLQFRGFSARVVMHEIDHLDGVLYVDHASVGLEPTDLYEAEEEI